MFRTVVSWSARGQLALALIALGLVALTAALRQREAQRLAAMAPGTAITSGCEEESMFAIWRQAQGQTVYLDPTVPPYAAAYFNWLFYRSYGAVARWAGPDAAPNAFIRHGRVFTLCGAAVGALALGFFAGRLQAGQPPGMRLGGLALVAFAFFGPLTGWWIVTLRPDLWALAGESLGMVIVLLGWRRSHGRWWMALAAACFYAAWAFKQNYVQGAGIAVLFLLWHRQWRSTALLAAGVAFGVVATLLTLGFEYRAAIGATALDSSYDFAQGLANFQGMIVRCLPLIILAASLPWLAAPASEPPLVRDTVRFASLGLFLSLVFSFLASCKVGAASNYYFTPSIFILLLALAAGVRATRRVAASGALLTAAALSCYVLFSGSLQLDASAGGTSRRWALWQNAPTPRFAHDQCLNLPWLSPGEPVHFMAFNYPDDRARGRRFEHDGLGGLIRQGYFASLLLPDEAVSSYDGASLAGYTRGSSTDGMTLWRRTPPAGNPASR